MPVQLMPLIPLANLVFAFRESGQVGQAIVIILLCGSMAAWSVMLIKIYDLRAASRDTARFLEAFHGHPRITTVVEQKRRFPSSPAFLVYEAVYRRWYTLAGEAGGDAASIDTTPLSAADIGVLRGESEKQLAAREMALDDYMGLLATAVTASPFLGLLGTVWGVMQAFTGMAMSGSAMLSAVAPGISAALLTTVVGLLVALPSLIGHNLLVNRIRRTTIEMHNFADELLADIERQYAAGSSAAATGA